MSWKKTASEFDRFAETYQWIFGEDKVKTPVSAACRSAIDRVKPRTILDCACGPGWSSIALHKEGYSVRATDISPEMIKLARANAREAGVRVLFTVAAWHELPSKIHKKFDFVMCHGNAIGHCEGERSMVRSLKAMRKVTKDGGHIYIDTRSWGWFRTKSAQYWPGRTRVDDRGRHTVIFRATIPRKWSEPHIIEGIHILEADGKMTVEAYPVTFYAFRFSELFSRLREAGFDNMETDYTKGSARYWVLAQAV